MKNYQVIEDNAGGLSLFVFDKGGKVEYAHTGYQFVPGQLRDDLDVLNSGLEDLQDWESCEENPQAIYDDITSFEHGWEIVADNDGLYPDLMGLAAQKEFQEDLLLEPNSAPGPETNGCVLQTGGTEPVQETAMEPDPDFEPEM